MRIKELLNEHVTSNLQQAFLSKGDVFLGKFEGIDHKKYFIISGLSQDKIFICTVFINSNIPDFIYKKQELLNLQVPIKGAKYDFLKHDSFVACNAQLKLNFSDFSAWIENKTCNYNGKLDMEDLNNIQMTLINSGLLTQNEIEIYFS